MSKPAVDSELIRREEEKRRRASNPAGQWRAFQALRAWLNAQRPLPRNSKASCLARQARWREVFAVQVQRT